jgi:hypothetical protein
VLVGKAMKAMLKRYLKNTCSILSQGSGFALLA